MSNYLKAGQNGPRKINPENGNFSMNLKSFAMNSASYGNAVIGLKIPRTFTGPCRFDSGPRHSFQRLSSHFKNLVPRFSPRLGELWVSNSLKIHPANGYRFAPRGAA